LLRTCLVELHNVHGIITCTQSKQNMAQLMVHEALMNNLFKSLLKA
jgi:hypothetical protein